MDQGSDVDPRSLRGFGGREKLDYGFTAFVPAGAWWFRSFQSLKRDRVSVIVPVVIAPAVVVVAVVAVLLSEDLGVA
jgi:hypothetical protein